MDSNKNYAMQVLRKQLKGKLIPKFYFEYRDSTK